MLSVDLNGPLSLYSIPVIWFASFYPHLLKVFTIHKKVGYNNVQPRSNTAKNLKEKVSPELAAHLERMEGAHLNGNEAMPLWFAAVLAGNFVGLDNRWMNTVSAYYVASRFLFNYVYINYSSLAMGRIRTVIYFAGLSIPLTILFKAAAKASSR